MRFGETQGFAHRWGWYVPFLGCRVVKSGGLMWLEDTQCILECLREMGPLEMGRLQVVSLRRFVEVAPSGGPQCSYCSTDLYGGF